MNDGLTGGGALGGTHSRIPHMTARRKSTNEKRMMMGGIISSECVGWIKRLEIKGERGWVEEVNSAMSGTRCKDSDV